MDRRLEPRPCVQCGALVELAPDGTVHTPYGCFPAYGDSRAPHEAMVLLPTLCWECRGGVLLKLPKGPVGFH